MLESVAFLSGLALMVSTAAVAVWTVAHSRVFRIPTHDPPRVDDDSLPRAAVLMGLKGTDPQLAEGLRRLLTQNYPDYEVHFVVDSVSDPAWKLVEQAIRDSKATHARMLEFQDVPENGIVNCTNSKVVQALRELDDSFEVVAMADGDVVTNENWLREIVSPLVRDPQIGVSTGNRWFIPPRSTMGSLAAHLWNVAAISVMYHLSMPWGGCYAIRTSTIRRGGLIAKWAKVAALDMHTTNEMRHLGLKVHSVPSLMMVNRGSFSLPFAVNWIRRQLTWARLYNPAWPFIVLHTSVFVATMLAAAVLGPVCYYLGATSAAWWAIGGLSSYLAILTALTGLMEVRIRTRLRHGGQDVERYSWWTSIPVFFAIPVTQIVQLIAVLQATFLKRVAWRGSILEINGPNDIRVINEQLPVVPSNDGVTKAA